MKAKKVKFWVRVGQISFWVCQTAYAFLETKLSKEVQPKGPEELGEWFLLIITLLGLMVFSEVIVRIIGYFAELLEESKFFKETEK